MRLLLGKRRRRIARAKRALRKNPSSGAYLDLARAYLAAGAGERALQVLERARAALPDSADIAALHDEALWSHVRQRARELQTRIDAAPRPTDVIALAHLFTEVGDLARAVDALTRGISQFADDPRIHIEMARLRVRLWRRDLLAADGLDAAEHLRAAALLAECPVEAHGMLVELCVQAGAFAAALEAWERAPAQGVAPAERARLERLAAVARERRPEQTEDDLEVLLDGVEANGRPVILLDEKGEPVADAAMVDATEAAPAWRELLLAEARVLASEPAVRAVLVQERSPGSHVHGLFGADGGEGARTSLIDVAATASQACQRIQIGRLKQATVSGPGGTVAMLGLGDELVTCLCDPTWRPRQAEERLVALRTEAAYPEGAES